MTFELSILNVSKIIVLLISFAASSLKLIGTLKDSSESTLCEPLSCLTRYPENPFFMLYKGPLLAIQKNQENLARPEDFWFWTKNDAQIRDSYSLTSIQVSNRWLSSWDLCTRDPC
jgi:hypothetical protein